MTITIRIPQPRALALVAAVLAVLLAATTVAHGATLNRNGGSVTAVRTVTSNEYVEMSGTSFELVPGMLRTVNVPAGQDALLVITFSAIGVCHSPDVSSYAFCYIRVRVDDDEVDPGTVEFDTELYGENIAISPNSMQFVHRVNASGPHTVTVQWATNTSSARFFMTNRTLTVLRSRIG